MSENKKAFLSGLKSGVPIGLGYFAVSFSLGLAAREVGLNWLQGFLASLFTIASAGEYAAFKVIGANSSYIAMAIAILVANCRYMLMSCSMSQRVHPQLKPIHRVGMGMFITDEIFAVSIAQRGYLNPYFTYGTAASSVIPWSVGTALGVIAGNLLPANIVTALSASLYGMFIAIVIPPAKKDRVLAGLVILSYIVSFAVSRISLFSFMSEGTRIIVLTIVLAGIAAVLFPIDRNYSKKEDVKKQNNA